MFGLNKAQQTLDCQSCHLHQSFLLQSRQMSLQITVFQVRVTLQLLPPVVITQEDDEGVSVPDITLFSEHEAVVPPFTPAQFQVQFVGLLTLLVLVPAVQL